MEVIYELTLEKNHIALLLLQSKRNGRKHFLKKMAGMLVIEREKRTQNQYITTSSWLALCMGLQFKLFKKNKFTSVAPVRSTKVFPMAITYIPFALIGKNLNKFSRYIWKSVVVRLCCRLSENESNKKIPQMNHKQLHFSIVK